MGSLLIWDSTVCNAHGHVTYIQTGELVKELPNVHKRKVNCILSVENTVWTGADDGNVSVWNKESHEVGNIFNLKK